MISDITDGMKIIHWTSPKNYASIITTGALLTNKNVQVIQNIVYGQGGRDRRLGDSRASLENPDTFYKYFDEAEGVYFRVGTREKPLTETQADVALVFSPSLLKEYDWILNTMENFGFYISEDGVTGEGQFSGEYGATLTPSSLELLSLQDYDPNYTELLVKENVSLKYLEQVLFAGNIGDYEPYKNLHDFDRFPNVEFNTF